MSDHRFDIIDAHHHLGGFAATMAGVGPGLTNAMIADDADIELSTRLGILDAQSVRQAVIIAGHSYLRPNGVADTRVVNDAVARYRDRCPERFPVAVGVVEPLYGEAGLAELRRCREELGLVGVSFHTRFQGVSMDSHWVRRYIEAMGEIGLVPFVHAFGQAPEEALWKIDSLAQDVPDLPMIVLDVFADAEQPRQVVHVGERNPQLLFDTSLALNVELLLEPAIARLGADRFVYGSDTYSWPLSTRPGPVLDQLLATNLDDAAKAAIVGGNLRAVLGL